MFFVLYNFFVLFLFYVVYILFFFFFFQAEDGIRDLTVTGVQTCALPIFLHHQTKRPRRRPGAHAPDHHRAWWHLDGGKRSRWRRGVYDQNPFGKYSRQRRSTRAAISGRTMSSSGNPGFVRASITIGAL